MEPVRVESYSGATVNERPLRVYWRGRKMEVRKVLSRWRDPAHDGFRVICRDGTVLRLLWHRARDAWTAEFDPRPGRGSEEGTR